jgi:hypothetical protein
MIESMRTGWLLVLTLGWSVGAVDAQQVTYVKSNGCGNIVLYGWTEDRTEAIIVRADRDKLGLHAGVNTVNVAPGRPGLQVQVEIYARTQPSLPDYYCNDVRLLEWERPDNTLEATSGTLLITLGEPGPVKAEGKPPFEYEATVIFRDVVFRRSDGTTASPRGPISLKAFVGFVFG